MHAWTIPCPYCGVPVGLCQSRTGRPYTRYVHKARRLMALIGGAS